MRGLKQAASDMGSVCRIFRTVWQCIKGQSIALQAKHSLQGICILEVSACRGGEDCRRGHERLHDVRAHPQVLIGANRAAASSPFQVRWPQDEQEAMAADGGRPPQHAADT